MVSELPLKPIKRIIKNHYNGEISKEACIYVRDYLLDVINYSVEEAVKEFNEYNRLRKMHKLPVLKRLDKQIFVTILDKIYIPGENNIIGKVGKYNVKLPCQGDNIINETKGDVVIKDAGNEVS